jgi:hypothetical protein
VRRVEASRLLTKGSRHWALWCDSGGDKRLASCSAISILGKIVREVARHSAHQRSQLIDQHIFTPSSFVPNAPGVNRVAQFDLNVCSLSAIFMSSDQSVAGETLQYAQ